MFEQLIAIGVFAFVASVTPGPNNVLLTAVGSAVGVRRGLPTLWGIAFGFAVMIFLLAVGFGETIMRLDLVTEAIKIAGILFLLWLAWQIGSAPVTASGAGAGPAEIDRRGTFFGAALFQWINPKAWLIATAVISAYMNEDSSALTQGAFFGAVFILAATVGCLPWLALGAVLGRFLQRPAYCRAFNVTMAVLLVGSMLPVLADFGRGAGQSLPTISETTPAMASATAASTGAPKSKRAPSMP